MRVGLVKDFFGEGTQEEVSEKVLDASGKLEELGAIVGETEIESLDYALAAYYIVAMAEASSNLSRYDGVRYGLRSRRGRRTGTRPSPRRGRSASGPR